MKTLLMLITIFVIINIALSEETNKVTNINGCEYVKETITNGVFRAYTYKHQSSCTNLSHVYDMGLYLR